MNSMFGTGGGIGEESVYQVLESQGFTISKKYYIAVHKPRIIPSK